MSKVAAGRTEVVAGHVCRRHFLAVGVHERHPKGGVGRSSVLDLLSAAAIGNGLPMELLLRAVDRTIGVEQRRRGGSSRAVVALVQTVAIEGEIFSVASQNEVLFPVPPCGLEGDHPVGTRSPAFHLAVAAPVVIAVERNVHTLEGAAARPGSGRDLIPLRDWRVTRTRSESRKFWATWRLTLSLKSARIEASHQVGARPGQLGHHIGECGTGSRESPAEQPTTRPPVGRS